MGTYIKTENEGWWTKFIKWKLWEKCNRTTYYVVFCSTLIILHGINTPKNVGEKRFIVDQTGLILLVLCMLPLFPKYIQSFKGLGLEMSIREKERLDEIFTFLVNVASYNQWTFYTPRKKKEMPFGDGFKILIEELLKNKKELNVELKKWLKSNSDNLKWFAAEVVGYYQIEELKTTLEDSCKSINLENKQDYGNLNCIWALSRFYNYEPFISIMSEGSSISRDNRLWFITACLQMKDVEKGLRLENIEKAMKNCNESEIEEAQHLIDNNKSSSQ